VARAYHLMISERNGKITINPGPVGHPGGPSGFAEYVIMELPGRVKFEWIQYYGGAIQDARGPDPQLDYGLKVLAR
jgi:hypothetical protein